MTNLQPNYISPSIFVVDPAIDLQQALDDELAQQQPPPKPAELTIINQTLEAIKIEQVRELTQQLSYARFGASPRYIVILAADLLTIPAQNALLKLLEEPPANTQLWLFTGYPEMLLPTIHSRCKQQLRMSGAQAAELINHQADLVDVDQLAQLSHRELIDLAQQYKDRSDAKSYLMSMLYRAHQLLEEQPTDGRYQQIVELTLEANQQLSANANTRLTLEHLFFACKQTLLPDKKVSK